MLEALVLSYGVLTSFVVSGVERNHRAKKPHSRTLTYAGYALCGSLGTASLGLTGFAIASGLGWM